MPAKRRYLFCLQAGVWWDRRPKARFGEIRERAICHEERLSCCTVAVFIHGILISTAGCRIRPLDGAISRHHTVLYYGTRE